MASYTTPEIRAAFNPTGARTIDYRVEMGELDAIATSDLRLGALNEDTEISRASQSLDGVTQSINWASFESQGFPLDGSAVLPPRRVESSTAQIGAVLAGMSGADGRFATPASYSVTTVVPHSSQGVTIFWGYTVMRDFDVRWYRGSTLLDAVEVRGNTNSASTVRREVTNFDQVIITLRATVLPYRRARVVECGVGLIYIYDRTNIEELRIKEETDPKRERAAAKTLTLTVDNSNREFDVSDSVGLYAIFNERMVLRPKIGAQLANGSFYYFDMGPYYVKAPSIKGNGSQLVIEATDIIGKLADTRFTKGRYTMQTVSAWASEVCADAGVTLRSNNLVLMSPNTYLPAMSHAKALQLISQATDTTLTSDRNGAVHFVTYATPSSSTLGPNDYDMDDGYSLSDDDIINTVRVQGYTVRGVYTGPETELYRDSISSTAIVGTFYVDNVTVTDTNGSYNIPYTPSTGLRYEVQAGQLVIFGRPLNITKVNAMRSNRKQTEPEFPYDVGDNPFITNDIPAYNTSWVAGKMLERLAVKRRNITLKYRGYPYIDIGDRIYLDTGGDTTPLYFVVGNELVLSGGMTGTLKLREWAAWP